MAPISKRLPVRQYSGPDPSFEISDKQFADLEQLYGITFSAEVRAEILARCSNYLNWRRFELHGPSYSDVRRLFEDVKKAVRPFRRFAGGHLFDDSDVSAALRMVLDLEYRRAPISVFQKLSTVNKDGSREPVITPPNVVLELNSFTLAAVAEGLVRALLNAEKVIQNYERGNEKGFAPGRAFRDFLLAMRLWAKEHGYPISPYKNTGKVGAYNAPDRRASPFAEFLFSLNQHFKSVSLNGRKVNFADPVSSADALAERLKDVAATVKRRTHQRDGGR